MESISHCSRFVVRKHHVLEKQQALHETLFSSRIFCICKRALVKVIALTVISISRPKTVQQNLCYYIFAVVLEKFKWISLRGV